MWANEQNVTFSKRETLGLSGIIRELVPMSILGLQQWKEKPASSFGDLWQFKVMFKIAIRKMQIKATLNLILPLSELLRMKQPTTISEQDVEKRKSLDTVDLQTGPITLESNQHGEFSKTNKQINKNLPHTPPKLLLEIVSYTTGTSSVMFTVCCSSHNREKMGIILMSFN